MHSACFCWITKLHYVYKLPNALRYALLRFPDPLLAFNASLRAFIGESDNMQRYPLATPEVNSYVRGWLVSGTLGGRVLAKCAGCKLLQVRYRLFNVVGTCHDKLV
jgi:hypothetical protein